MNEVKRVARWLALVISLATLSLASWIFIPAPTYFLLTFGVGAPEVSAWLVVASLVALGLTAFGGRASAVARITVLCALAALALALTVLGRLPSTIARFDTAMDGMTSEPRNPMRRRPVAVLDLFRGVPIGNARVIRDIPFASPGGVRLALDVYQPPTSGRYPIVVQIYGGAWQRGEPGSNADFAAWLSSSGYVVFAIDYRHAPRWKWPIQIDDVDAALAWIRDHAADYGGDTARVVLIGRSAGAHLAMLAAYRPAPLTIRGVISYYGPTDLADAYRHPPTPDPLHIRRVEEAFLGGPPDSMPDRYLEASPLGYATHPMPPTLLVYGARDHIVEARYGAALRDRLAAAGTPVVYLEIPWAEHAFDAVFNGPSSQLALYYTERFVAWATR